jgi:hypothetical protein
MERGVFGYLTLHIAKGILQVAFWNRILKSGWRSLSFGGFDG